jgi:hypothetical protein
MKKIIIPIMSTIAVLLFIAQTSRVTKQDKSKQTTICNPLNLGYRFCLDTPSRREAADPVIVVYKGEYYLFASI